MLQVLQYYIRFFLCIQLLLVIIIVRRRSKRFSFLTEIIIIRVWIGLFFLIDFQIFGFKLCFFYLDILEMVFFLLVCSIFDGDDFYFFRYMNFFFISLNVILDFLFEKSVIYFDSELVSYRVYVFLFKVKFICIFVYLVKRVYFWYQVYLTSVIQLYMEIYFFFV